VSNIPTGLQSQLTSLAGALNGWRLTRWASLLPKIAAFFQSHPRNLYRDRVYGLCGPVVVMDVPEKNEQWSQQHTWNKDRPIQCGMYHWLRFHPVPKDTPPEKGSQRAWAEYLGENRFKITSQNARRLRIYLHPKMIDFSKPVEVTANGQTVFNDKVFPKVRTMLELVREFDDRGRIFYAAIDFDVPTDADVPEPQGNGKTVLTKAAGGAVKAHQKKHGA